MGDAEAGDRDPVRVLLLFDDQQGADPGADNRRHRSDSNGTPPARLSHRCRLSKHAPAGEATGDFAELDRRLARQVLTVPGDDPAGRRDEREAGHERDE